MKVIESFIEGKTGNPDLCEDGLVIKNHFAAVIDGVTAKSDSLWNGKKSGCYAKNLICSYLEQNPVENMEDEEILRNLNQVLQHAVEGKEGLKIQDYPRASIIFYQERTRTLCSYGDCQCLINGSLHTHKKRIDDMNASIRAFYLDYALMHGSTINNLKQKDTGREAIKKNLLMQFSFENKNSLFGYPVLNGTGINSSLIVRYSVAAGDVIVLASDGYPELSNTLEDSERKLAEILEEDPMCFKRYLSTKGLEPGNQSFDDRTYLRFKV